MEIISVLFVVLSGAALFSCAGRLILRLQYEVVALTAAMVLFGVGGLSLIVFTKFGVVGICLSFITPSILSFTLIKSYNLDHAFYINKSSVLGFIYWMLFLIVFTFLGLKSGVVTQHINNMYSLESTIIKTFYFIFLLSVVMGGLSLSMLMQEGKKVFRKQ